MMIEAEKAEKEEIKEILEKSMQNAIKLKVPLLAEVSEADNWYDCK